MSSSNDNDTAKTVVIPVPLVAPFGWEVTSEVVQEIWDTYVKPDQDAGRVQSGEMRILMAILRAVYDGLSKQEGESVTKNS